jgi:hypothetical protein
MAVFWVHSPLAATTRQIQSRIPTSRNSFTSRSLQGPCPHRTDTIYFVFLPSGVTVGLGGSSSCQNFCGYHDAIKGDIYYAVMPYPSCKGCQGGLSTLHALTATSSHEFSEAITDPVPGQGWYDDNNGEIGDICAWQFKHLGKYTVQLEWSNKAGRCM